MLKNRKLEILMISIAITAAFLNGCKKKEEKPAPQAYVPKELAVQFVPSKDPEALEAKAKPLEKLLEDKLGMPVKINVSANYNTLIDEMASKQVDVGFLPPTAYVLAHEKKAADVILQAQRYAVKENGSNSDQFIDTYKSIIIVKKDSQINSIQDLKGKKIAWQDTASTSGYIYPAAEIKKIGIDPTKELQGVTIKGHDKAVLAVLKGDVDAAAVFEDARNNVKKDKPDVFNQTKIIYRTQGIPNDTISVRSDMDKEWKDKIAKAFTDIAKNPEGLKIIKDTYDHVGYIKSQDSNFEIIREYQKAIGFKK